MAHTSQGKEHALAELEKRRAEYKDRNWSEYSSRLPAGAPMYYGCIACNGPITVPESHWGSVPKMCGECRALKELDWLVQ